MNMSDEIRVLKEPNDPFEPVLTEIVDEKKKAADAAVAKFDSILETQLNKLNETETDDLNLPPIENSVTNKSPIIDQAVNVITSSVSVQSGGKVKDKKRTVSSKHQSNNESTGSPIYKYNEDQYIKEINDYIASTYSEHYSGKIQALDVIYDSGFGTGFNVGNIQKYSKRYGKKEGYNRKDLLKILHYTILQLYIHDTEQKGQE